MQLFHVKKRDGRLVTFNIERLTQSIISAAAACDITEDFYARELAEAVALHLSKEFSDKTLKTNNIADAVEKVLKNTKYNEIANAYAAFRFSREKNRSLCTVLKPVQSSLINADDIFQVTSSNGQRSNLWDRSKIVIALEREANIGRNHAEEIARAVEEKLLSSDLTHVTTTLIRALTDNELLTRGYTSALLQSSSVTVPFSDLELILDSKASNDLNKILGKQVTAPYTLSHTYSENVAMAHRRGIINISGLEHPFSTYEKSISILEKDFLLGKLRELWMENISLIICQKIYKIKFIFEYYNSLIDFSGFLKEVCDYSNRFLGKGKVTFLFDSENIEDIKNILLNISPVSSLNIGFYNLPEQINKFADAFSEISKYGWTVSWSKSAFKNLISQKISINFPQTVYRARQRDIEGVIEEIYRSLDFTVQARKQFCIFDRKNDETLPKKHSAAVDIIGLYEAVAILTGTGLFENNEAMACTRVLLSTIQYGLQQAAEPFRISMFTSIDNSNFCGKRFATIDQSLFPELFGFLPLQPENIESLIPPYESILLEKKQIQSSDDFAKEVVGIYNHFDIGFVPIAFDSETDSETIVSIINSKSSFEVLPNNVGKHENIKTNKNQMRFNL